MDLYYKFLNYNADNDAVLSKKKKVEVIFYPRLFYKNNWNFPNLKPLLSWKKAQIDYGGRNELDYVIRELCTFDQLVGLAMEFVDTIRKHCCYR
jgi:hypothetical protein